MPKILANDGIDTAGKTILEKAGITVDTTKVPQEELINILPDYDGILVRSATTVHRNLIDACPNLKLIGRAGVGLDNIDVEYAREKGIEVINTPEASGRSVAEITFAHLFAVARFLPDASRHMPKIENKDQFDALKKKYTAGFELTGKTIGIIGFGSIGMHVARIALGMGMRVLHHRRSGGETTLRLDLHPDYKEMSVDVKMTSVPLDQLLAESDIVSIHVPFIKSDTAILAKEQFAKMKDRAIVVNTSRGGAIDETCLLDALNNGKIAFACLDVYEGEPLIRETLRQHPHVSLTPHIGGSTKEAQERIGIELAEKTVRFFNS